MALDSSMTPDKFQELIQNKDTGFVFVPNPWDWNDIGNPKESQGFLGAFKAISCELPFEQQKNYIEKMDVWAWMQVMEHQRADSALEFLLPRSTESFSTHTAPQTQKDVLSAILKEKPFDSFSFSYPIAQYIERLNTTNQGKEILKEIGKDFSSKYWATLICHESLFVTHEGTKYHWYDPNPIQMMCEICGGYEKFSAQDWLRVAESYESYLGLEQIKDYYTKYHVWDKITPDTLVAWFENRENSPFNSQAADSIIAQWADLHGKINESDNAKKRNLVCLYMEGAQGILDSTIKKQLELCNITTSKKKRFLPFLPINISIEKPTSLIGWLFLPANLYFESLNLISRYLQKHGHKLGQYWATVDHNRLTKDTRKHAKVLAKDLDKLTPGEWVKVLVKNPSESLLREWEQRGVPSKTTTNMWCALAMGSEYLATNVVSGQNYDKMSDSQITKIVKTHPCICQAGAQKEHITKRLTTMNTDMVLDICRTRPEFIEFMGPQFRETFEATLSRLSFLQEHSTSGALPWETTQLSPSLTTAITKKNKHRSECSKSLNELRKEQSKKVSLGQKQSPHRGIGLSGN